MILDKNVLQSLSPAEFRALASQYRLLMPDVLFFECLKADAITRSRCFGALPAGNNPIRLSHHVGHHLQYELTHGTPLGQPDAHPVDWDYRFHEILRGGDPLPADVAEKVDRESTGHESRVREYVDRIRLLVQRVDEVCAEHGVKRPEAAQMIRTGLADLTTVREFLSGSRDPGGNVWLPPVEALGPDSAIVVHFQVIHALALQRALDQGREFDSDASVERMTPILARDLFDADYLILGLLQGGLATRELRLRRIFRWLRPGGILWPSDATP
ncbi:MAG: hypothetical protein A2X76_12305 [Lysobacterales bacterium GWF1_69_6]|nr:MAG: hypothetical protein A2X76_12305 [Xanthomonadales bacterium GWF1_69_6]